MVRSQFDELAELQDIERGCRFHGFAAGDLVVLCTIGIRPAASTFSDIAHHRLCRSDELVCSLAMPPGHLLNDLGREGEKFNGALVDVEALEAQHNCLIGRPGSIVA